MLKVLHFYKTHKPQTIGGVEQFVDHVASSLSNKSVETRVLSLCEKPSAMPIELNGYQAFQAKTNIEIASTPFSVDAFLQFRRYAKWADVIHLHYPYPFADLLHVFSGTSKPTLLTYHSDIVKQKLLSIVYRPLEQQFLSKVDRIVATSENYLDTSVNLKKFASKTRVIPIGLVDECKVSRAIPLPKNLHEQFDAGRYFLFVGVLRYYKGLHNLVQAAKDCDFPILIAGQGPEKASLEAIARKENVENVHFLGEVSNDEKSALMANCRGFVFPSDQRSEAFGLSLVEASMHGKPMISCEIGTGTTFVNLKDVTGLVCKPSSPEELRFAMNQLWHDRAKAEKLGRNARKRYEELFTAEKMADAYLDIYRELAGKGVEN